MTEHTPTIVDVAELANVSKSTVSNVVRGTVGVAPQTRDRVERAIADLGYRPNALARQFVQQRTTLIGVLVGDLDNPFYGELSKRVERCAFEHGYTTMFCNIEGPDEYALPRVRAMVEQRVAGVVLLTLFARTPVIEAELEGRVPVVFAGLREQWGDSVSTSDAAGGRLAIEHLIQLDHRRIAFVTSPHVEQRAERARYNSYRSTMRAAGLQARPPIHWDAGSETATIRREVRPLLDEIRGGGATAAFCANDLAAIALLDFCDRHAIKVPDALSVVGFDDVYLAGLMRISLTTVRQPLDQIAATAVDVVMSRLDGTLVGPARHVVAAPSLVVRASTAKPRRR